MKRKTRKQTLVAQALSYAQRRSEELDCAEKALTQALIYNVDSRNSAEKYYAKSKEAEAAWAMHYGAKRLREPLWERAYVWLLNTAAADFKTLWRDILLIFKKGR